MKRQSDRKNRPDALTGELMLAKMMIEERDEVLDSKEATIRELVSQLRASAERTADLTRSFERTARSEEIVRTEVRAEATREIISEIIEIVAAHEDDAGSASSGIGSKIVDLFRQKYGLRVIEDRPRSIDPDLHRVVAIGRGDGEDGSIEIVSKGYGLGGAIIRPAEVRVTLGVSAGGNTAEWSTMSESDQFRYDFEHLADRRYEPG